MKNVCDRILNSLKEKFDSIDKNAKYFSFLDGKFVFRIPEVELKMHAMDFCIKHEKYIDKNYFVLDL